MNKACLLVICLLLTSFTGCIEGAEDLVGLEKGDGTNYDFDNTNNTVDETNNTVDDTNNTVDDTNNTEDDNLIYFQPQTKDEFKTELEPKTLSS